MLARAMRMIANRQPIGDLTMSGIVETLKLKEQAEEDLYFARHDRDLTQARRARPPHQDTRLRVMAGGQTGVDRAALDAARNLGLAAEGWCPQGRWAEDGVVPERYALRETPGRDPAERTDWNVRDSDATLILHRGRLAGGSAFAAACARRHGRPLLIRDLTAPVDALGIVRWLQANRVRTLHCAGPRESEAPGIQAQTEPLLHALFAVWALPEREADEAAASA